MYYQHIDLAIVTNKLKFEQMEDSKPLTLNDEKLPINKPKYINSPKSRTG
jgi:hypothetical protein